MIGPPHDPGAGARSKSFALRHRSLTLRSCLLTALLVLVVLPAAGLGLAVWLFVTPTAPEAEAMRAYRSAPVCTTPAAADCITIEQAEVVDVFATQGRCGSRTDTFKLRLDDGVHLTNIYFDCFAPNVYFAPIGGQARVREFRARVTTVYSSNGTAYETGDSPTGGSSWRGGVAAVLIIFSAPVLLIGLIFVVGLGLRSIWRLLRDPSRPLPTYADR